MAIPRSSIPQDPSDDSTTLNLGVGGDVMDESLIVQADGTTEAKRPRVVVGFDDGTLQSSARRGSIVEAAVSDAEAIAVLHRIHYEARKQTALLKMLLAHAGRSVGDDEIAAMAASDEEP